MIHFQIDKLSKVPILGFFGIPFLTYGYSLLDRFTAQESSDRETEAPRRGNVGFFRFRAGELQLTSVVVVGKGQSLCKNADENLQSKNRPLKTAYKRRSSS
jgi:hypothetical protein